MDKNLLIAVALSIGIYALWFGFIEKRIVATQPTAQTRTQTTTKPEKVAVSKPAPKAVHETETARLEAARLDPISFANGEIRINPRGAAIASWKFTGPRGVVELVLQPQPGFLATFPDLDFKRALSSPGLVYTAARADGLLLTKEFLAGGDDALPRLRLTMINPGSRPVETGAWTLSMGPGLGTIATEEEENAKLTRSLGLLKGAQGLQGKLDVFADPAERAADYRWVGVDNRYFLAAMLPAPKDFAKAANFEGHLVALMAESSTLAPKASRTWEVPFYVGAKGHTWLSRYRAGLERSIDFGFFAQLGRFVLKVLGRLHALTGNWGWAIILLTVILQFVLFPLTYKSLKATAALKKLQPEIARLQQRYSKEPAKLNTEMMQLYKQHGANPLGGCLPMLVQMPVFVALFNALRNAWELHGASWIFWIKDLSAKDPYYVLPVVMGGLMFVQNKLTPAATDPTQAQMMNFMPIIFTFMFMNFPSGLVLYWLTNSLFSTLQQLALRNRLGLSPAGSGGR